MRFSAKWFLTIFLGCLSTALSVQIIESPIRTGLSELQMKRDQLHKELMLVNQAIELADAHDSECNSRWSIWDWITLCICCVAGVAFSGKNRSSDGTDYGDVDVDFDCGGD